MSKEDMRERFEIWVTEETGLDLFRANYPMTKPEDQPYKDQDTLLAWITWQAAVRATECD